MNFPQNNVRITWPGRAAILSFEVVCTNLLITMLAGDWSPAAGYQPA